eukprot:4244991-Pleurochrysis_carterae.AAC.1
MTRHPEAGACLRVCARRRSRAAEALFSPRFHPMAWLPSRSPHRARRHFVLSMRRFRMLATVRTIQVQNDERLD